jgi:molecular chaperone GrpE
MAKKTEPQQSEDSKSETEISPEVVELTNDLQRTRADFENYRKRIEIEKAATYKIGQTNAILKIIPIIDTIERAVANIPTDLQDNAWVHGIASLSKNIESSLKALHLKQIETKPGDEFDPNLHDAVQFDETSTGDKDVVAEVLQAGYLLDGEPIRHTMVKVTKK